jgi:hypothetical protein
LDSYVALFHSFPLVLKDSLKMFGYGIARVVEGARRLLLIGGRIPNEAAPQTDE